MFCSVNNLSNKFGYFSYLIIRACSKTKMELSLSRIQGALATTTARATKTPLAIKMNAPFSFYVFGSYFNSLKVANIGELPYRVLGTAPMFGLREEVEFVSVCLRPGQTKSQKEIQRRVHTGCKEKRATRAKFVLF